jgi:hypothetical protein
MKTREKYLLFGLLFCCLTTIVAVAPACASGTVSCTVSGLTGHYQAQLFRTGARLPSAEINFTIRGYVCATPCFGGVPAGRWFIRVVNTDGVLPNRQTNDAALGSWGSIYLGTLKMVP